MRLALGSVVHDVTHRALVMGIANRTPDSFYDRGRHYDFDAFCRHVERLVDEGADLVDVGGVRAAPGIEVTPDEEIERVVPAVAAVTSRFDVPVSVDTFRAVVLDEACRAGAVVANDISGFADPAYLDVAARHGATVVATHVRLGPRIHDPEPTYDDVRSEVVAFLARRVAAARARGIDAERIIVDAGLDLGKTPAMSLELLRHSDDLVALGCPVLLSASNKGFLGELLGGVDVDARAAATVGAHTLGLVLGCRVLRVHDVEAARRVADLTAALLAVRDGDDPPLGPRARGCGSPGAVSR